MRSTRTMCKLDGPLAGPEQGWSYVAGLDLGLRRDATALVILPGGFGTMDELFETLTLIQTLRVKSYPVFIMGSDYWKGLFDWLRNTMLAEGCISPEDLDIFTMVDDPVEVAERIEAWRDEHAAQ